MRKKLKFTYHDQVLVINGFYRGCRGKIIDWQEEKTSWPWQHKYAYHIELEREKDGLRIEIVDSQYRWVLETNLIHEEI